MGIADQFKNRAERLQKEAKEKFGRGREESKDRSHEGKSAESGKDTAKERGHKKEERHRHRGNR